MSVFLERMCANFSKRAARRFSLGNDPKTTKQIHKCGGNINKLQALIDLVKREWLSSKNPDDWIYKMVLINIEEKYPNCKVVDKGETLLFKYKLYINNLIISLRISLIIRFYY